VLASAVAKGLCINPPEKVSENHGMRSEALSMINGTYARYSPMGRKIGIYVPDGEFIGNVCV